MKFIRLSLITLSASLLLCARVWGAEVGSVNAAGGPFFLRVNFGYIAVLSEISVSGPVDADIYLIFSRLIVEDGPVNGTVYGFSSDVLAHPDLTDTDFYQSLLGTAVFEKMDMIGGYFYRGNIVPEIILKLGMSLIRAACVLILFSAKRGFFEQGFCAVLNDTPSVLKAGVTFYFFCAALAVIFLLSVFLLPVSLLIIAAGFVVSVAGETSAAQFVGYTAAERFDVNFNDKSFGYTALGLAIIEALCLLPVADGLIALFVMPIVASGILYVSLVNAVVRKKFYYLPYA